MVLQLFKDKEGAEEHERSDKHEGAKYSNQHRCSEVHDTDRRAGDQP